MVTLGPWLVKSSEGPILLKGSRPLSGRKMEFSTVSVAVAFWCGETFSMIPETLPDRVLEKMKAPPKDTDVAVIRPEQLAEADGFVFGSPSRFGMMASQVLAFFDATHELWLSQKLAGKPAGIFWSTGFHGGGQENTALTAIPQLAHHGILFVPLGYTFGSGMYEIDEVKGGSSYGAGTYAGDGSRQPTELELQQAFYQGKYVAGITKKLKATST